MCGTAHFNQNGICKSDLPMITVNINDKYYDFLLDSGSTHSFLTGKYFPLMNKFNTNDYTNYNCTAINGSNLTVYNKKNLNISINNVLFSHTFFLANTL